VAARCRRLGGASACTPTPQTSVFDHVCCSSSIWSVSGESQPLGAGIRLKEAARKEWGFLLVATNSLLVLIRPHERHTQNCTFPRLATYLTRSLRAEVGSCWLHLSARTERKLMACTGRGLCGRDGVRGIWPRV
jgi:hypothetical protein